MNLSSKALLALAAVVVVVWVASCVVAGAWREWRGTP